MYLPAVDNILYIPYDIARRTRSLPFVNLKKKIKNTEKELLLKLLSELFITLQQPKLQRIYLSYDPANRTRDRFQSRHGNTNRKVTK